MRQVIGLGLAALAGAAIGGAGVGVLYAQAKPPVFTVTLQQVSNAEALAKEFVPLARPLVKANGGVGIASSAPTALEGASPANRVVINQWQSIEQAKKFYGSAEYAKVREVGNKYAKFQIFAVEGLPK